MFTIEKDDFTGFRKINSEFYGLNKFLSFDGPSDIYLRYMSEKTGVSDAFDLLYIEAENGQGSMCIRVCSSVAKYSGNTDWPNWDDNWPMIVDGERLSLNSSSVNSFESNYELKIYDLPVDVFNKICNASEVKYSLRGKSKKLEGIFTVNHLTVFKAFEQYCFGDENEGNKLLEPISNIIKSNSDTSDTTEDSDDSTTYSCYSCKAKNIVPNDWETFSCHSCHKSNSVIKPKNLTEDERKKHENKVAELIKDNKVDDAIKYYASNFGYSEDNSKEKVKTIAVNNGLASVFKKYENKQTFQGCLIIAGVVILIMLLFKAC